MPRPSRSSWARSLSSSSSSLTVVRPERQTLPALDLPQKKQGALTRLRLLVRQQHDRAVGRGDQCLLLSVPSITGFGCPQPSRRLRLQERPELGEGVEGSLCVGPGEGEDSRLLGAPGLEPRANEGEEATDEGSQQCRSELH